MLKFFRPLLIAAAIITASILGSSPSLGGLAYPGGYGYGSGGASPTPTPTASPLLHLPTFGAYGVNDLDHTVSGSTMAAYFDYVETNVKGTYTTLPAAFQNAGGKYVVGYTDPVKLPHCPGPYTVSATSAACTGGTQYFGSSFSQGNSLGGCEACFTHNTAGTVRQNNSGSSQENLNTYSPTVQAAYGTFTTGLLTYASGTGGYTLNYIFMDDSGGSYVGTAGTCTSGGLFFSGSGWAYTTDPCIAENDPTSETAWQNGIIAMATNSALPAFVNGGTVLTQRWISAYLGQPNMQFQVFDGCITNPSGPINYNSGNPNWVTQQDDFLYDISQKLQYLCIPTYATQSAAVRTYQVASFLLAYDPAYSIYASGWVALSDGYAVVPDADIVPYSPVQTATGNDITTLTTAIATSPVIREFGQCYQRGVSIGRCAVAVNPTGSSESLTSGLLTQSYSQIATLPSTSVISSGAISWGSLSLPKTLTAHTAAIIAQ